VIWRRNVREQPTDERFEMVDASRHGRPRAFAGGLQP